MERVPTQKAGLRVLSIWTTAVLGLAVACADEEQAAQSVAATSQTASGACSRCDGREVVECSSGIGPLGVGEPMVKLLAEASTRTLRVMNKNQLGPSLLLSGGGSYGAWGAGVLYGRQLKTRNPYEFDQITGVSTGALMGTLVFIGDYQQLKKVYTAAKESDIQKKTVYWRSMYSREPLRETSRCILNNEFDGHTRFEQVRKQADAGRSLLVGTVDLNDGKFCTWDMSCIACKRDQTTYLEVVMASANAPLVGPPVELAVNGEKGLHVDGGTRAQIFARASILAESLGPGLAPEAYYFLVNGKIEGSIGKMKPRWDRGFLPIAAIASRGLEILQEEALALTLQYYEKHLRDAHVKSKPKPPMYVSRTPKGTTLEFAKRDFITKDMAELFREGCNWGWDQGTWPEWQKLDLPDPRNPTIMPIPQKECKADVPPPKKLCEPEPD